MAAGTRPGFMSKDYTPRMKRLAGFAALLTAFTLQGCIATTLVLHVAPDGHGRAVITSRVFEPALHAFDSMFSDSPKHAKTEEQLPPPGLGELRQQFGAPVTLASTKLDKVPDGVIRTTIVEFDDVTKLRMGFPPAFAVPSGGSVGMGGVVTFAMKPHDNGDRLLLVRLPDDKIDPGPDPEVTVFKTDSPEELLFKRAIKGMSVKFFVELDEVPLLRTNAPSAKGSRATILDLDPAVDITNNTGYDNQPFFTPDGRSVLFTSVRGPAGTTQTDIYRYDIAAKQIVQVTRTPESEYSATVTPDGNLSVIRVELDAGKTQRLWQFTADGANPRVVLENVKPVGYHAWADSQALALFVLGQPATLQLADTRTGIATVLGSDIGRSIQRIPAAAGQGSASATISFVQRERTGDGVSLVIKELNPVTRAISVLTPAVTGSREADCAWTPDGTLLMANGGTLYSWRRGQSGWKEVVSLERLSLAGVTRLAVSPKGDYLALVGAPRQAR